MLTASRYVDGTIVDLSLAWTIPHIFGPEAGLRPAWTFMSMAAYDLWSFQTYIIDVWNAADREECPELPHTYVPSGRIRPTGSTIGYDHSSTASGHSCP